MSNIPSIIEDAEQTLIKLDGMIDKEDYSKLKAAVDELGASFRKRAYGYTLNELYTVATLLKSKNITADDLPKLLNNIEIQEMTKELLSTQVYINLNRQNGKTKAINDYINLVIELRKKLGISKSKNKV